MERRKIMQPLSKRGVKLLSAIIAILALAASLAGAATIQDISNNCLKIGNDIYSMNSDKLTDDNIAKSLNTGDRKVYFKIGGRWYDVFAATSDSDLGDPSKALSDTVVNSWTGLNKWYKDGSNEETITDSGGSSSVHISTVTASYGTGADTVTITFDAALSAAPSSSDLTITRKVDGAADSTALSKGTVSWSNTTPTVASLTVTPQVTRGSAEKTVKYSAAYKGGTAVEHSAGFPVAASNAPAAPTATVDQNTGAIGGLDPSTTYEYRRAGDTTWTTYNPGSPPNLPGETIYIRVKANGTTPAGLIQTLTLPGTSTTADNTIVSVTAVPGPISDTVTVTFSNNLTAAPAASDLTVARKVNAVSDTTNLTRGSIIWSAASPKTISFSVTPQVASGTADNNVQYSVAYKGAAAVLQAVPFTVPAAVQYIHDWDINYSSFGDFYIVTLYTRYEITEARINDTTMNWDGMTADGYVQWTLASFWNKNEAVTVRVYDQAGTLRQTKSINITVTN